MRLASNKITSERTPLMVTGSLDITGGTAVQFWDGTDYTPNREGSPASPISLTHNVKVTDPDNPAYAASLVTLFYEDNVLISSTPATQGYEIIGNVLKVKKNIPGGKSVEIKAVSKFTDVDGNVYERQDTVTLRTLIKAESPYQMNLIPRGIVYFDGYRNPNTAESVTAIIKKGNTTLGTVEDFEGITFKWLNKAGEDILENELYADSITPNNRGLFIDKTYIDKETIRCEAWKGSELLASDSVTYVRKFNSFRTDIRIPELPLQPGINRLSCSLVITDMLGTIDVDKAFLVDWMVSEDGVVKKVGTGASVQVPVSGINLKAKSLEIYPEIKRREAFAALITDADELLTDDDDNVLTVETFGI